MSCRNRTKSYVQFFHRLRTCCSAVSVSLVLLVQSSISVDGVSLRLRTTSGTNISASSSPWQESHAVREIQFRSVLTGETYARIVGINEQTTCGDLLFAAQLLPYHDRIWLHNVPAETLTGDDLFDAASRLRDMANAASTPFRDYVAKKNAVDPWAYLRDESTKRPFRDYLTVGASSTLVFFVLKQWDQSSPWPEFELEKRGPGDGMWTSRSRPGNWRPLELIWKIIRTKTMSISCGLEDVDGAVEMSTNPEELQHMNCTNLFEKYLDRLPEERLDEFLYNFVKEHSRGWQDAVWNVIAAMREKRKEQGQDPLLWGTSTSWRTRDTVKSALASEDGAAEENDDRIMAKMLAFITALLRKGAKPPQDWWWWLDGRTRFGIELARILHKRQLIEWNSIVPVNIRHVDHLLPYLGYVINQLEDGHFVGGHIWLPDYIKLLVEEFKVVVESEFLVEELHSYHWTPLMGAVRVPNYVVDHCSFEKIRIAGADAAVEVIQTLLDAAHRRLSSREAFMAYVNLQYNGITPLSAAQEQLDSAARKCLVATEGPNPWKYDYDTRVHLPPYQKIVDLLLNADDKYQKMEKATPPPDEGPRE